MYSFFMRTMPLGRVSGSKAAKELCATPVVCVRYLNVDLSLGANRDKPVYNLHAF
jgi:hypothetical protein